MKTALFLLCFALCAAPSAHAAAPVIDGNLADFIAFGEALSASGSGFYSAIADKPDLNGVAQPENIYNDTSRLHPPARTGRGSSWRTSRDRPTSYRLRTGGVPGRDPTSRIAVRATRRTTSRTPRESPTVLRIGLDCNGSSEALQDRGEPDRRHGPFAGCDSYRIAATGRRHDLEIDISGSLPALFLGVRTNAFDGLTRTARRHFVAPDRISRSESSPAKCAFQRSGRTMRAGKRRHRKISRKLHFRSVNPARCAGSPPASSRRRTSRSSSTPGAATCARSSWRLAWRSRSSRACDSSCRGAPAGHEDWRRRAGCRSCAAPSN